MSSTFSRNYAEALEVYAKAFNASITEMQKYGDMPPNPAFPIAESDKGLVLHARLLIDGAERKRRQYVRFRNPQG